MEKAVMVSVVCNAYNHGPYIAQALQSFVSQETDFVFEVLVHDDASTDDTADVIRRFAEQYPDIIKPIYQTENQYSKKIGMTRKFQYARAAGKYIAWCEGDDYWTDPHKLQKQVDALEKYPQADICAHRAVSVRDGKASKPYPAIRQDRLLSADQVIRGGGAFVATNSLMFRKSFLDSAYDYTHLYNLDFVLQVSGALRGGMVFVQDVMAAYRVFTPGSWTAKMKKDHQKQAAHREKLLGILEQMDRDTEGVHADAFAYCIHQLRLKQLAQRGAVKELLSAGQKAAMASQPVSMRVKLLGLACCRALRK